MERVPFQGIAAKHIIAMKFSTEAIVALAVAIVFALLSWGAIAREQGQQPADAGHANTVKLSRVLPGQTGVLGFY
jgi:hypothetical protein